MARPFSLHLRFGSLLALAVAGPLVVRRFGQVALWSPEFIDEHGSIAATEGGPVELLFVYRGISSVGAASRGLAPAGDVDGDGVGDLALLAVGPERGGGGTFGIRSGADGRVLQRWLLPDFRRGPHSVEAVGDLDADGVTDVLVGQGTDDSWSTRQYWVCSGATGRTLIDVARHAPRGHPLVRSVPAARGAGARDLVITGDHVPGLFDTTSAGASLCLFEPTIVDAHTSADFDVDGDGRPEIALVCKRPVDGTDALVVEVVSTADGAPTVLRRILPHDPPPEPDQWVTLCVLGDTDGDGVQDLALGVPTGGLRNHGSVRIVSGATGEHLVGLHGEAGDGLGVSIASLGDLDGDGLCDFAVSGVSSTIERRTAGSVRARRYPGGGFMMVPAASSSTTSTSAVTAVSLLEPGFVQVHSGANGALLCRIERTVVGEMFGQRLTSVGDLDGDGLQDLAVEAPGERGTAAGKAWRGSVYIFSGASLGGSR